MRKRVTITIWDNYSDKGGVKCRDSVEHCLDTMLNITWDEKNEHLHATAWNEKDDSIADLYLKRMGKGVRLKNFILKYAPKFRGEV